MLGIFLDGENENIPRGLKPSLFFGVHVGTTEVVPFQDSDPRFFG